MTISTHTTIDNSTNVIILFVKVYTRVLMGAIDLARATFLDGTPDTRLDILARWNLFKVGLNYRHGTGHGIGSYGFIHESPIQVSIKRCGHTAWIWI